MGLNTLKISSRNRAFIYLFPYLRCNFSEVIFRTLNSRQVKNGYLARTTDPTDEIRNPYVWLEYDISKMTTVIEKCLRNHPSYMEDFIKENSHCFKMSIEEKSYMYFLKGEYSKMFPYLLRGDNLKRLNGSFMGTTSYNIAYLVWTKHWMRKKYMERIINQNCDDNSRIEITKDMEYDSKPDIHSELLNI
jgi:hypothetical protein